MPGYLKEARVLAEFANISDQKTAEYARENFAGFAPATWWLAETDEHEAYEWKEAVALLHKAWRDGFPLEESVRLISLPARMDLQLTEHILETVPLDADGFSIEFKPVEKMKVWPFQSAVMFLAMESWRARHCLWCNRRFVADIQSRRYCSDACFRDARNNAKRDWWNEEGTKQRREKRAASKTRRKA